jgi:amidohydrolase
MIFTLRLCLIMVLVGGIGFGMMVCPSPAAAVEPAVKEKINRQLSDRKSSLIDLRRDLHRHPEPSGQEERTARVVADRLRAIGLEVREGVGGFGVIGILRGQKPGPVVAYRADMDAVQSDAPDPVAFTSETPGIRHICGHDVHTTIAIGIAEVLAELRTELPGTVKFIFQPAEENAEGARAVIADGALEQPAPAAIFAVHCAPLELGQIASCEGMILPGLDVFELKLSGDGDLAAAAGRCTGTISGVTSSKPASADEGPAQFINAVVFQSGPDPESSGWTIRGIIRASSEEMHVRAQRSIEEGLTALDLTGVSYELNYTERAILPTINDAVLVQNSLVVLRELLSENNVIIMAETISEFSEDFAFYQDRIPGAMYFLGVSNTAEGIVGMPHHPQFRVDENAINIGARAMAMVLWDYLENN